MFKDAHCKQILTFMSRIRFKIVRLIQEVNENFLLETKMTDVSEERKEGKYQKNKNKIEDILKFLSKNKFNIDDFELGKNGGVTVGINPKKLL